MVEVTPTELQERILAGESEFEGIECREKFPERFEINDVLFENCEFGRGLFDTLVLHDCSFVNCSRMPDFDRAYFYNVDFTGSDLRSSDFYMTQFSGRLVVKGAKPPYSSGWFWAELLKQRATTIEQKQVTALIYSASYLDWCWYDFLVMNHPLQDWVLETLRSYELDLTYCPHKARILLG